MTSFFTNRHGHLAALPRYPPPSWALQGFGRYVGKHNPGYLAENIQVLKPVSETRSMTELAVTDGFIANPQGLRGFRIGIDASIWFFHAEYGKEGENPVLRTLFFRCATLMRTTFLPLFVFDGPKRPDFKRGKKINKTSHKLIPGMKAIIEAFGFEWRMVRFPFFRLVPLLISL